MHQKDPSSGSVSKALLLSRWIVIGTTTAFIYHMTLSWIPGYDQFPWNTFLFIPADRFNDFRNIFRPFTSGTNPYHFKTYVYFPALTLLMLPFQPLGAFALKTFGLLFGIGFVILTHRICRKTLDQMTSLTLVASLLISYPFLFSLDRANIECLMLLMILLSWQTRNTAYENWGCLLLGWVGAIKLYPLLYLLPDLMNWRFRKLALTASSAVVTTLIGFKLVPGDNRQTLVLLAKNLRIFHAEYVTWSSGVHYSASLLAAVKAACFFCSGLLRVDSIHVVRFAENNWRFIVLTGLAGMLVAGWKLRKADEWKCIFAAVAAMILLPPVSFDYKLLHLILPMVLFINTPAAAHDRVFTILFGLLMIPKAWFFISGDISIAVILNPVLICLMLVMLLIRATALQAAVNSAVTEKLVTAE